MQENTTLINETITSGDIIELCLSNDEDKEFEVIAVIELDNKTYLILMPLDPFIELDEENLGYVFVINQHFDDQDSIDLVLDDEIINQVKEKYILNYANK